MYVKVGRVSILRSEVETKSLEELKNMFPKVKIHIMEQIFNKVHKKPKKDKIEKENKEGQN